MNRAKAAKKAENSVLRQSRSVIRNKKSKPENVEKSKRIISYIQEKRKKKKKRSKHKF